MQEAEGLKFKAKSVDEKKADYDHANKEVYGDVKKHVVLAHKHIALAQHLLNSIVGCMPGLARAPS